MQTIEFRTLRLVLGEPASQRGRTDEGAVSYHWRCGCRAICADGYKCTEIAWCQTHDELLWLPLHRRADTGEAEAV
jgi:hypothetical protein